MGKETREPADVLLDVVGSAPARRMTPNHVSKEISLMAMKKKTRKKATRRKGARRKAAKKGGRKKARRKARRK